MSDTNYILSSDGTFMSDNELRHYGIKGLKWGVRRYPNYDGSYTKALAGIGALSMAAAGVNEAANYGPNKKLRAYYSHTSSY